MADAICAFNPFSGQGMRIAAIAEPVDAAWKLAAAGDLRCATDRVDLALRGRMVNRCMTRLLIAAQRDPTVAGAFHRVMQFVDMPPV